MTPRSRFYADLRPEEIENLRTAAPIAYVPWGALEWHSHHAPTGLDSTKAFGICAALADVTGGLVLPPIPLGASTIKSFKGFAHSIEFSASAVSTIAEELCRQLVEERFRIVVLLTGHYSEAHTDALRVGASRASAVHRDARIVVWPDSELLAGEFDADHAGATETSFQLLFAPTTVLLSTLPKRRLTLDGDGVSGEDPRNASSVRGARQLECAVRRGAERVHRLLAEIGATP